MENEYHCAGGKRQDDEIWPCGFLSAILQVFFYNRLFEVTGQIQLYILVAQNWSKKLN